MGTQGWFGKRTSVSSREDIEKGNHVGKYYIDPRVYIVDTRTKTSRKPERTCPFGRFRKKHIEHPDLPLLIKPMEEGGSGVFESLFQGIYRES